MSLIPHNVYYRRPQQSQAERYFGNFFDEATRELGQLSNYAERMDDRLMNPYWMGHNLHDSQTLANAVGNVQNTPEKFAVSVNVSHFRPDELKVTTVGQQLVIEGKHEEKSDEHGQIERHFVRKVLLPKDVHADRVVSHLTPEGVLTVSAPKLALNAPPSRTVPIQAAPIEKNRSIAQKKDPAVEQKKGGS